MSLFSEVAERVRALLFLGSELRYAARALRENPVFSGAAVVVLGLGLGAGTTVFAIADSVAAPPVEAIASD